MKKITAVLFVSAILSCNSQEIDTKAEGEKIMQLSKEWSQAASAADADKTLGYWADDAILFSPGQPPLNGKKEIKKMIEQSFGIPGFKISWQPLSVQVSASGDMAYLLEDSELSFTDSTGNTVTEKSKAVSIWRKQSDGAWKNVVDISTPAGGETR